MRLYDPNYVGEPNKKHSGRRKKEQEAAVRIDAAIKHTLKELSADLERLAAFLRLLACIRNRTQLLKPTAGPARAGWVAPVFLISRLKNLASRQRFWIRPCETWPPSDGNLRPVFRSLAHHLLAHYPVPAFMDSVWDLPPGPDAFRQQAWWIRLGRGSSLRSLDLPIVLTRRMAHHARHAP